MPGDRAIMNMVGSPLNDFERANQLFIDQPAAPEAAILNDSLYAINSTYMEVVDQTQSSRHWGILIALLGLVMSLVTGGLLVFTLFRLISLWLGWKHATNSGDVFGFYFDVVMTFLFFATFAFLSLKLIPKLIFYLTRLPIRLNRKKQKMYVIRSQKMWQQETWEIDWHDPRNYFCVSFVHRARKKKWSDEEWQKKSMQEINGLKLWYEIRCYQLDDKGLITRAFCLGEACFNGPEEVRQHWEYYRRYMSEGPQNLRLPHLFWRADERNSLIEMFAVCKGRSTVGVVALLELLTLPIILLIHLPCRVLSLWTSREAKWPDEVEAACQIEPDDPWARPFPNQPIGWANNEDRHKKDWGWLSSAERYAPEKLEHWRSLYEPAQQWAEQRYPTDETV